MIVPFRKLLWVAAVEFDGPSVPFRKLLWVVAVEFDGPSGACGGELRAESSVQWFTSPLFPSPYPANLVCDWIITASLASDIITLQVSLRHVVAFVTLPDGQLPNQHRMG